MTKVKVRNLPKKQMMESLRVLKAEIKLQVRLLKVTPALEKTLLKAKVKALKRVISPSRVKKERKARVWSSIKLLKLTLSGCLGLCVSQNKSN